MRRVLLLSTSLLMLGVICSAQPSTIEPGYHLSYQLTYNSDSSNLAGIWGIDDILAGLDLNKNGKKEILCIDDPTNCAVPVGTAYYTLYLYEENGNNSYTQIWRTTLTIPCNSLPALGTCDFDGDGNLEIIVAIAAQVPQAVSRLPRLLFFEYDPNTQTFPAQPDFDWDFGLDPNTDFRPSVIATGDFDNDGHEEIAIANRDGTRRLYVISLDGIELGGFSSIRTELENSSASLQGGGIYDIKVVDFDNDGNKELWVITWNMLQLTIFEATGPDTYAFKTGILNVTPGRDNGSLDALHFGDFFHTGSIVGLMAGTNDDVFLLEQTVSDVAFVTADIFKRIGGGYGGELRGAGVGDPDRDGKVDLFFTNNVDKVYHMEYKGTGPIADSASYDKTLFLQDTHSPVRYYYVSIPDSDMDGDNMREVVVGSLEQDSTNAMFVVIESDVATGVFRDPATIPTGYQLEQNYPNPFNPSTEISFTIPSMAAVTLVVYDIQGREIRRILDNKYLGPARYTVRWDGADARGNVVPSGVYFYAIKTGDFTQTRKMTLIK